MGLELGPIKELRLLDRGSNLMADKEVLIGGGKVTPDHLEIDPTTGMQKEYVVLSKEERVKGFVRPVRKSYVHIKCGQVTRMHTELAETYARDPKFYTGTYCSDCETHFPVGKAGEFVWEGTNVKVGT